MGFTFDHQHIRAAGLREVISDTRSDNAATDDDDVRGFHADAKLERISLKVKCDGKLVAKVRRVPRPSDRVSPQSDEEHYDYLRNRNSRRPPRRRHRGSCRLGWYCWRAL